MMQTASDLERTTPDGFTIAVRFVPSLEQAAAAVVHIARTVDGAPVDSFPVSARQAADAFRHTALYSEPFRAAVA